MEPTARRFVRASDADPEAIAHESVAVIGYGNLGRSLALNLRDAGLGVVVGNIEDSYRDVARADGFDVEGIAEAVTGADVVLVMVPDEEMGDCYETSIAPRLSPGTAVVVASGYCLAFGLLAPASDVDVLLMAPRMLGDEVRRASTGGSGFVSYLNVEQDASGRAWPRLLALAAAAGGLTRGALVVDAGTEARLDLFIEQTVGAWLGTAIQVAFEVGVESGLPAEALVLEMYQSGEMGRTFDAFARQGFYRSAAVHGATALYGGFLRTLEIDREGMTEAYRRVLADIAAGGFARAFQAERDSGGSTLEVIAGMVAGGDPQSRAEDAVRDALG